MKRSKKLIALLAVLILLTTATLMANIITPKDDTGSTTTPADTTFTLLTIDPDMVSSLSWTHEDETLNFTCTEDVWSYADDSSFPLDSSYISSMLSSISNIEASKKIEAVDDLSQYGLDSPECSIWVGFEDGYEMLIGNETAIDGLRYFSIGDGNVYLIEDTILDTFSYGLYDLLQKESVPTMSDIVSVGITSEIQSLSIEYIAESNLTYSNEYVWFLKNNDTYMTLDTELTDTLIANVTDITFGDCVNYNADNEYLSIYGLTAPAVTATIVYIEDDIEKTFTLELGNYTGDNYCYARIAGSRMVYLVDASISDTLMYIEYSELQPDEVLIMNWDTVTKVDVTLDDTTYTFTKTTKTVIDDENNTSEESIYTLEGLEVDITDILDSLTALTSTGYSNSTIPERSAEVSFVIHRNTESFSEIELVFYQYDSNSCLVSLNGETTVFTSREDIVAITEAINAIVLN